MIYSHLFTHIFDIFGRNPIQDLHAAYMFHMITFLHGEHYVCKCGCGCSPHELTSLVMWETKWIGCGLWIISLPEPPYNASCCEDRWQDAHLKYRSKIGRRQVQSLV